MKKYKIEYLHARQILDSRGNPTVEVECAIKKGGFGIVGIPSGASTGSFEAVELRDGDKEYYNGKSVKKAVENVNNLANKLIGMSFSSFYELDELLLEEDGTENKSKLGANATLGISLAFAKAIADTEGVPFFGYLQQDEFRMPVPMMNIMNGGKHADSSLNVQEFMIVPHGADSWSQALEWGVKVYQTLKGLLKKDGKSTGVGDEGGFAPKLDSDEDALSYLVKAIKASGLKPGDQVSIALDVASSEMYNEAEAKKKKGQYLFWKNGTFYTADELSDLYGAWIKKYPIISIEDPFAEEDWEAWSKFTKKYGKKIMIVGDDLYVTNPNRLVKGIDNASSNAILIKPNQIGTLSETLLTMHIAHEEGYACVVSHRSGETSDSTIADLAVATGCGWIKTGAPCRTDRVEKYNQLTRIEEWLGNVEYGKKK